MISNTDLTSPAATRREWVGLAVLALPTLLLSLDLSVLHLALPHLASDLDPDSTQMLWIMDIYGFMIAGFLVTMGTLGDRIGRRRLLVAGAAAFGAASVLAAYSTSAEMLIATRALLGVAGATLMPSTLALISTMFRDARQRAGAIGVWMSCFMAGIALGPVIGGALLEAFWWGSAFLLGVPVMALLLVTAPLLLPEARNPDAGRLDLVSVAMSLVAILPFVYGLKRLAADPGADAVVAMALGLVAAIIFVRRQRRLADPLLDLKLFTRPTFSVTLALMLVGSAVMGGMTVLVSQYLQLVEGLSPLRAGTWLVPAGVGVIVGSLFAPALAQRIRPAMLIGAGLVVAAAGLLVLAQGLTAGGPSGAVVGFSLAFFGVGPIGALGTDLVVGSAPPERAGSASSVSETVGELSIALGVAVMGTLAAAIYRRDLGARLPSELPTEMTTSATDSLVGATGVATELPDSLGVPVLGAARAAFTEGLTAASWTCAAVVLATAVVAVVALRQVPPTGAGRASLGAGTP